jgi:hypothetical protein
VWHSRASQISRASLWRSHRPVWSIDADKKDLPKLQCSNWQTKAYLSDLYILQQTISNQIFFAKTFFEASRYLVLQAKGCKFYAYQNHQAHFESHRKVCKTSSVRIEAAKAFHSITPKNNERKKKKKVS